MRDFKRLLGYLGPYRWDLLLGGLLVLVECAFELVIPVLMADIIDVGVAQRDIPFILRRGVGPGRLGSGWLAHRLGPRPGGRPNRLSLSCHGLSSSQTVRVPSHTA